MPVPVNGSATLPRGASRGCHSPSAPHSPCDAGWVASLAVELKDPREDEQVAADAICAVVDVAHCERLEPRGHVKTPDWRMVLADGRVADVEVTGCTDGDTAAFFAAFHERDGTLRSWEDERLSWVWDVVVIDRDPGFNKKRRPLKKLVEGVVSSLAAVEKMGGTPEQMESRAQEAFDGSAFVSRTSDTTLTLTNVPRLQIDDGKRSQHLRLSGAPRPVEARHRGQWCWLRWEALRASAGYQALVSEVQDAIDRKTNRRQMDGAPDLKWLAVMVGGIAGFQLGHYFGPGSPYYDPATQMQPPALDGISFSYFDEVWVVSVRGDVVLRLSDGGLQVVTKPPRPHRQEMTSLPRFRERERDPSDPADQKGSRFADYKVGLYR